MQQTSTVYGELKLSDLLNEQLKELKGKFDELQEKVEEVTYQREEFRRQLKEVQQKYQSRCRDFEALKSKANLFKVLLKESL